MKMNEIYVRNYIINNYDEGKTKEEIVDYFFNNNGVFLWGYVPREKIEQKVDKVIYEHEHPEPKK